VLLSMIGIVLATPAIIIFIASVGPELVPTNPDGTPAEPDVLAFLGPLLLLELALFLVMMVLAYLFHVEMMFRSGQTLGKRIMKIRVVPIDPARTALTRGTAFRRFVPTLIPMFNYVDGLWQLWDKPYQQCLHDKFAGTVVVKVGR